jgi:hypothetical protein
MNYASLKLANRFPEIQVTQKNFHNLSDWLRRALVESAIYPIVRDPKRKLLYGIIDRFLSK